MRKHGNQPWNGDGPIQFEADAWGRHMQNHPPIKLAQKPQPEPRIRCICYRPVVISALLCAGCLTCTVWAVADRAVMAAQIRALTETNVRLISRMNQAGIPQYTP
jgi:hypothetical protein